MFSYIGVNLKARFYQARDASVNGKIQVDMVWYLEVSRKYPSLWVCMKLNEIDRRYSFTFSEGG